MVSDEIKEFIRLIVDDFEIEEKELLQIWQTRGHASKSSVDYSKKSLSELKALCKEKKLKVSGTKKELVERLTKFGNIPPLESVTETKTRKKRTPPMKRPVILQGLEEHVEKIHIRRNTYGYYEHPETGFIFDEKTHQVIGKQREVFDPSQTSDSIEPLTAEDIEKCKELRFEYVIPDTL